MIPLEVLFGEPQQITPQISPDGTRIAWLAPRQGVLNLWIRSLDKGGALPVTNEFNRGIISFFWAANSRELLYLLDRGGDEKWRLLSASESGTRELVAIPDAAVSIVGRSRTQPDTILVSVSGDLYRLDLVSGTRKLVLRNPGDIAEWIVDNDFQVVAATTARDDGGFDLVVPNGWRPIVSWSLEDSLTSSPLAATERNSLYVIDSRERVTGALIEMDLPGTRTRVVAADENYDVGHVLLNPRSGYAEAAAFQLARNEWHVLDDRVKEDFRALAEVAEGDFYVISRDDADRTWIVVYLADTQPVMFFLYSRDTRKAQLLFEHEPRLRQHLLTPTEPISLTSRDGLTLHGYLTLPRTRRAGPGPLVLKVHSGPWTRDEWGFDPQVQWFADMGYACLQVNFRGSTGYGKHFLNAGNREWGGKMQDDLIDALHWAIERSITEPKKIAVFGQSWGGYAALMSAAFHSHLLACVVDIAGPTDLLNFVRGAVRSFGKYSHVFTSRVGSPETDALMLHTHSPLHYAERFKVPVLLAHGENDPRVPKEHSDLMAAAFAKHHVSYEYLVFPEEGHGFGMPASRFDFYQAVGRFLTQHLPPHR